MTQILKVEKTGDIKLDKVSDISELYKKCGFRKNDGFEHIHTWERTVKNNIINIELWGRTTGKSTIKNRYEFPQPFNKTVYGNCVLIGKINMELINIDEEIWGSSIHPPPTTASGIVVVETITPPPANSPIVPVENFGISHTIDLTNFSALAVTQKKKKYDHNDDNVDDMSFSDNEDYSDSDSELKEESYLYSSEEECGGDSQNPHIP